MGDLDSASVKRGRWVRSGSRNLNQTGIVYVAGSGVRMRERLEMGTWKTAACDHDGFMF